MDTYPSIGGPLAPENKAEEARKAQRDMWTARLSLLAETSDRTHFTELFRYFAPRIKAYLVRLGLTDARADEVAQDAMTAVWKKAHLFDGRKASASTWVFTLARNLFIDLKRRERVTLIPLQYEVDEPSEPEQGSAAVMSSEVLQVLDNLPVEQAQVVYLAYYEGCSHNEISKRLDLPLGSVKSRMRLAFQKLRRLMAVAEKQEVVSSAGVIATADERESSNDNA